MKVNDRTNVENAGVLETDTELDVNPGYWVTRGAWVGLTLGASAGTIYPVLGTAIGAVAGTGAGFLIGVVVWIFAAITRSFIPAGPRTVEWRERVACLVVIWAPLSVFRDVALLLAIPAALGSIHAFAAGTPTAGKISTGQVSILRQRVCNWLPAAIVVVVALVWTRWSFFDR